MFSIKWFWNSRRRLADMESALATANNRAEHYSKVARNTSAELAAARKRINVLQDATASLTRQLRQTMLDKRIAEQSRSSKEPTT
jgi:predicted  nucleic acid-binding Zn-ribbon protein